MSGLALGVQAAAAPAPEESASPGLAGSAPQVYAVASGKGGVGKSILSILLAAGFARAGKRVLLMDGAFEQGTLHLLLGVRGGRGPVGFLQSGATPGAPVPTAAESLWLLPGGHEPTARLDPVEKARLHLRLTRSFDGFDTVIVDAGPGIDGALRAAIHCSRLLTVTIPEPASLHNAFALIKAVSLRAPHVPVELLINRATGEEDAARAGAILDLACRRFLDLPLPCRGVVAERSSLRRAARDPGAMPRRLPSDVKAIVSSLLRDHAAAPAAAGSWFN